MKTFKSILKASKNTMFLLAMMLGITSASAQMNGSYTIDATQAASSTNFVSWATFATAFNAAAITGPVTVDVKSNLNIGAAFVTLNANAGSSSTNTLTINGNNTTMTYASTYAALRLNGVDYATIKNMTIENNTTTPGAIWITNQADYNTIDNVTMYLSANTTATTGAYYVAMSTSVSSPTATGSAATGTTGQPGLGNTISNCLMYTQSGGVGPYYAISLCGNTSNYTTTAQNNAAIGNTIKNFYFYGIFQAYTNGNVIKNNDISRANATSGGSATLYGIYSNYSYCANRSSEITNNNIHDLPFTGATTATSNMSSYYLIYNYYPYGTASIRTKMEGNIGKNIMSTSSTVYGFYAYYPQFINVNNNTLDNIQASGTSATLNMIYVYYPTNANVNGNTVKNVVSNYYLYNFYIYYGTTLEISNNIVDNCKQNYSSGYFYNFYIYYPKDFKVNNNVVTNNYCAYYFYNFYIYYGGLTSYTWNEFQDNIITGNTGVNYNYSAYIYYYNGTNNMKVNRNYVVNNKCTGSTGYHYFYLYYFNNYEVTNNVVAGNYANSQYIYIYSGLSGTFNAEIRNNTFQANTSTAPTPGSSYIYCYLYLYYHTVYFTGNIIDLKGSGSQYYRYLYMYLSYSNIANLKEFDYNTYSLNNLFTYPYWYFNGTNYVDWAGFSGAGMNGPNDNGIDPLFVNIAANDWRPGAWGTQNNVPYKAINVWDVKDTLRNKVKHDRGGLETNTDLQAMSTNFSVPSNVCAGYSTGSKTHMIIKSNYQYDKVQGFKVSYAINGGPKTSVSVTKALALGDTVKVFFPQEIYLSVAGQTRLAIFIDMPDDKTSNDSFIFNTYVTPAPGGGFYTVNPSVATRAMYQPSKNNDITVLNAPVSYSINQPRIYTNSEYKGLGNGDKWSAALAVTTPSGKTVSLGGTTTFTMTAPTATSDMVVTFKTTDKTLEDSMLNLYVIVHDEGNGCDTLIKRPLLIYPTIVPNFTKPTQACLGEPVLFENKSTVASGNMEYIWDFGTGVATDKTDAPDPVFVFTKEGTYKVKMTAKTLPYGFVSEDSTIFTVNPIPAIKFTKMNACEGYDLVFNNMTTPSTGTTYAWEFGDNTSSTLTSPTHKYSKQGTYNVKLTATLNGCVAKMEQRAYQFEKPKAAFSKLSGDCDNKEFVFTNSSSVATASLGYFWNFDDGSFSTAAAPKHIFDGFGTKNVKLIVTTEFGCQDSIVRVISVKESPKVKFVNGPACSLKPTQFTNTTKSVPSTYANYTWSFSDGTTSTDESPSHSWTSLGSKTVTLQIALDNGCSSSETKKLDVLVQPKAFYTAQDVCAGSPVAFNNKTTWAQGEISYDWNFSDNTVSTETAPVHMYGNAITLSYKVTLIAKIAGGCTDTFIDEVTVNEGPKTCDFTYAPDYAFGYYGMKLEPMDGSGKVGAQTGVKYTWVIENGGSKNGTAVQHNFVKDGTYNVTMYAIINNSTCECSKTKTVLMNRASVKSFETSGVMVYPNPATDNVNVALKETFGKQVLVNITSLSGAMVKQLNAENNGLLTLNTSDITAGVYMITVSSGSNVFTQKLIVQ